MRISSIVLSGVLVLCATAWAQPWTPLMDSEVVERIPEYQRARALKRIQDFLLRHPRDVDLAAQVAESQLSLARRTGDSRYLGHAQASLAPWWNDPRPPARIALMRAILRQRRHEFQDAISDLQYVLRVDPVNARAWFAQAVVWQVMGEYAAAEKSCRRLEGIAENIVASACLESVLSLNGHAADSYNQLSAELRADARLSEDLREWVQSTLADIAARIDRPMDAERHFRAALALDGQDLYLLNAYADFLLDRDRPSEVLVLLQSVGNSDGVLLRLALAELALGGNANSYVAMLNERFASYRQRNDMSHLRDEARFALEVQKDAARALVLARQNWQRQHEPWDARLVLMSALAARDMIAAREVRDWMARTRIQDVSLQRLAKRLEAS